MLDGQNKDGIIPLYPTYGHQRAVGSNSSSYDKYWLGNKNHYILFLITSSYDTKYKWKINQILVIFNNISGGYKYM